MKIAIHELETSLLYSEELGIDLATDTEREYFKWFLASILFGGHISETIARNTYATFAGYGLLDPRRILDAGSAFLIDPVMREGGYVRYDGRKTTQILRNCNRLIAEYDASLTKLRDTAQDKEELESRLLAFFGIGPVTVNIFLRELRPYWAHADPEPLPVVRRLARKLGIDLDIYDRKSVVFSRIEAGLIRLRRKMK